VGCVAGSMEVAGAALLDFEVDAGPDCAVRDIAETARLAATRNRIGEVPSI